MVFMTESYAFVTNIKSYSMVVIDLLTAYPYLYVLYMRDLALVGFV